VAILLNGKVYGGDSSYSYQGNYLTEGALLIASIRVFSFNEFSKSIFSAFGETDEEMHFSGKVDAKGFSIEARLNGIEGRIAVEGKWISKIDS
jgi:hypothetical protein